MHVRNAACKHLKSCLYELKHAATPPDIYSGIHEVIVSVFSLGGSVGLSPKPMVFTILVSFFIRR